MLTCDKFVIGRVTREPLLILTILTLLLADFVADDATNAAPPTVPNRTATGQDGTTYGTNAGANGCVLPLI